MLLLNAMRGIISNWKGWKTFLKTPRLCWLCRVVAEKPGSTSSITTGELHHNSVGLWAGTENGNDTHGDIIMIEDKTATRATASIKHSNSHFHSGKNVELLIYCGCLNVWSLCMLLKLLLWVEIVSSWWLVGGWSVSTGLDLVKFVVAGWAPHSIVGWWQHHW